MKLNARVAKTTWLFNFVLVYYKYSPYRFTLWKGENKDIYLEN